ncbi:MAG: hypothetical protein N3B21_04190 [Clostridia bacterium]|nr:hypothetical protein [Clostridia bacterium]
MIKKFSCLKLLVLCFSMTLIGFAMGYSYTVFNNTPSNQSPVNVPEYTEYESTSEPGEIPVEDDTDSSEVEYVEEYSNSNEEEE